MRRVVVVDDEPITRMDLSGMLEEVGFQVVGEAGDGFDAVEVCRAQHPDAVLMDVKMPVFDGLTAAQTVLEENLAQCVVLLTAFNDPEMIERAKQAGVTGYLVKPVEQRLLLPTIEVALAQSERLRESRKETDQVRRQLANSRIIQRAQAILARQEKISETEAYQKLRRIAMDKRIQMAAVAQALIDQELKSNSVAFITEYLMKEKHLSETAALNRIKEKAEELGCSREEAARQMRRKMEESH